MGLGYSDDQLIHPSPINHHEFFLGVDGGSPFYILSGPGPRMFSFCPEDPGPPEPRPKKRKASKASTSTKSGDEKSEVSAKARMTIFFGIKHLNTAILVY